jgi:dTDP-4-amino-4,6-dideoxygalactose transaminase
VRHNPFRVVEMFEETMADYCGSPYAIATDNCTDALMIAAKYLNVKEVTIPARTYLSVPQSILHAGGTVKFRDYDWKGIYQLEPYPLYDSAKRLTSDMYIKGSIMCLSFHIKKLLPIGKGGMILTDDKNLVYFAKRSRYEGRQEIRMDKDNIALLGWNAYMTPEQAARGLTLMHNYPTHAADISNVGSFENEPYYPDLRDYDLFKNCETVE